METVTKKPRKKKKSKAGRKAAADPKIQVTFWIETSKVTAAGGMEKAREKCIVFLGETKK